jgi:hypothetical protein
MMYKINNGREKQISTKYVFSQDRAQSYSYCKINQFFFFTNNKSKSTDSVSFLQRTLKK